MSFTVSTYEAKTNLASLLRRVEAGESITITRRGVEIAEITPRRKPTLSVQEAVRRLRERYEEGASKKPQKRKYISRAALHEGHKY